MSAVARYRSMSWIPAANESSVGARVDVMRERRDDTVDGGIGRKQGDNPWSGCESRACPLPGSIVAKIVCCEGSNNDALIFSSGCDSRLDDLGDDCICLSFGGSGRLGFIEGIEGGRRSEFRECRSRCSLSYSSA